MSTHKHIDRICVAVTLLALLITVLFMNGEALGLSASARTPAYESTLFDTSRVHTVDIVIDDWDAFLETATSEEYTACSVVIDNEAVKNVAIRGKGNTSLSTVASMDSERYSFKIEFDHYETEKTYKGLDKLCLNNLIQDNTYMKDYLAYRLMAEFGVDAPLCSYVWVTVNGEPWGLYLAVEAVEDSFLDRVYGGEGELYKPDSMSMGGGGPGHGREFNMEDFLDENADAMGFPRNRASDEGETAETEQTEDRGVFPQPSGGGKGERPHRPDGENGPSFPPSGESGDRPEMPGGFGMGSSDVKLQYTDDDPDSYSNIFENAKTNVTGADKARLIRSLKALGEGEALEDVLDLDEVLRYFVVHNYLVNGDSYTGSMIHNYYLHEADGKLSMIPWDYNLAFGTFQGRDASYAANDPIDSPLSVSGDGSRPMADWIFQSGEYTELYHQYFSAFLDSADVGALIDETAALIAPYVEKDPTAFCTYEEFETGVAALKSFCEKRTESVRGQLDGTIPSTDEGQEADPSNLVDASDLTLSDMGSMGGGNGGPGGGPSFGSGGDAPFGSGGPPSFDQNAESGSFGPPESESGDVRPPDLKNGPTFGGAPDMASFAQTESAEFPWLQLVLSAAVLTLGLLAAFLYKKRA